MAGKRKQRQCGICKRRPAWQYKNCPPGVCKRCYHKHVWADRPAARRQRQASQVDTFLPPSRPGGLFDDLVGFPEYAFLAELQETFDDGGFLDGRMQ